MIVSLLMVGMLASVTTTGCPDPDDSRRIGFDEGRAAAGFVVRAGAMNVHGDFERLHGTLHVARNKARACVSAELEAASLTMPSKTQGRWARSADFFNAERYPQLRFRSSAFDPRLLLRGGRINGRLTLRGVTRQQRVLAQPARCSGPPAALCTVSMRAALRRSAFGMRARRGLIGDRVDLVLRFEAPRAELELIDDPSGH